MFKKFKEAFWDEKSGFYASHWTAEEKSIVGGVQCRPCLWSGIIAPERARTVVKRLMRKDMWSGWGIRTLSADHPHSIRITTRPARCGRITTH